MLERMKVEHECALVGQSLTSHAAKVLAPSVGMLWVQSPAESNPKT